jgi:GNAT superfamily N-acetyltransferase
MKPSGDGVRIGLARTPREIARCHAVMRELRPQFIDRQRFVERVQRQQDEGYLLAFLETRGRVRAVAGYRYLESLYSGRFLYVDDLVTSARARSSGYGSRLLGWLIAEAQRHGCQNLELDSGVQRFDAHRFYLVNRMKISSYHFALPIEPKTQNR